MFRTVELIPTYDTNALGGNPEHSAQLFRKILKEGLHLLPPEDGISKKDIDVTPLEGLARAVRALCGEAVIAVTTQPVKWREIIGAADRHPLCDGWTDFPVTRHVWPHETKTRFLWHQEAGLICATQHGFPEAKAWVAVHGTRIRIFPWTKANLRPA